MSERHTRPTTCQSATLAPRQPLVLSIEATILSDNDDLALRGWTAACIGTDAYLATENDLKDHEEVAAILVRSNQAQEERMVACGQERRFRVDVLDLVTLLEHLLLLHLPPCNGQPTTPKRQLHTHKQQNLPSYEEDTLPTH